MEQIAGRLKNGEVVALPTETVFGLACALNSGKGVAELIRLKNRDVQSGKVFTLVPERFEDFERFVEIPGKYKEWLRAHIPGPVTAILSKSLSFSHPYFDNFEKIGLRIPDYQLFEKLLPMSVPILLTSANPRGLAVARTVEEVRGYFPGIFIVEGEAGEAEPSTVIDFTSEVPKVLREGPVKF